MDKVFIEEEAVMTVAFREADIPLEQPPSKRVTEYQLMWRAFRRDPLAVTSLIVIIIFVVGAVFAPWLTPYPDQGLGDPNILEKFVAPDATHPLGTDYLGRDVLARVLYGGRSSLSIGFLVVFIAVTIGVPLGAIAGYYGGWIDNLLMRITDIFLAFPPLLLAIALAAALGSSFTNTMIAISFTWWPWYSRLVRAQTLSLREQYFIEASRSIGVPGWRIIISHVLPNVTTPVLVQATMDWGQMISIGRIYFIERPWYAGSAGLAIFLVTLAFNLLGDSVRDAADPHTRRLVS
jgi:peptide/nickel transport system permease protein